MLQKNEAINVPVQGTDETTEEGRTLMTQENIDPIAKADDINAPV